MTAEFLSIVSNAGQNAVAQIRQNMAATGTNATGKSSQSLRYEIVQEGEKTILRVLGRQYFAVVETGRRPTPQYDKPSREFVAAIKEWAQAKGIEENAAYAIAKSIHKKGTKLYRSGGRQDVYTSVIPGIVQQIGSEYLQKYAHLFLVQAKETLEK
jgi:hypothetical protein